jgi:hypothetical protein
VTSGIWNGPSDSYRTIPDESVVHIHGEMDDVFPIKYIKGCTVVKGGSHIMILNKYRWFNANFAIILNKQLDINEVTFKNKYLKIIKHSKGLYLLRNQMSKKKEEAVRSFPKLILQKRKFL